MLLLLLLLLICHCCSSSCWLRHYCCHYFCWLLHICICCYCCCCRCSCCCRCCCSSKVGCCCGLLQPLLQLVICGGAGGKIILLKSHPAGVSPFCAISSRWRRPPSEASVRAEAPAGGAGATQFAARGKKRTWGHKGKDGRRGQLRTGSYCKEFATCERALKFFSLYRRGCYHLKTKTMEAATTAK